MKATGHVRRGGATLEAALVLPLLLMLAFGVVEYGYFFYVQHTMQGAARTGARAAIVPGSTAAQVNSAIDSAMSAAGFASNKYTKSFNGPAVTAGTSITVTVQGTWGTIGVHPLPETLGGIAPAKVVRSSAVMVKE